MSIELHQVDAFTDRPFRGNPAAVCFPERGVDDAWVAHVAAEMNLSETAFLWPEDDAWRLRWHTPLVEVDLCGHATLAAAHVLFETGRVGVGGVARFHTRSGVLTAERRGMQIELDFPATLARPADPPDGLLDALGVATHASVLATPFDLMVVLESERAVRELDPDFRALRGLGVRGVIVTASGGSGADIVSRFFAPGSGIDEDPVTGSAHCALGPYWSAILGKNPLRAEQASPRGGTLDVEIAGDRVKLRGHAVTVLSGQLRC